jgi:hypothetical protein
MPPHPHPHEEATHQELNHHAAGDTFFWAYKQKQK